MPSRQSTATAATVATAIAITVASLTILTKYVDASLPSKEYEITAKACIYGLQERISVIEARMKTMEDDMLKSNEYYNLKLIKAMKPPVGSR